MTGRGRALMIVVEPWMKYLLTYIELKKRIGALSCPGSAEWGTLD